MSYSAIINISQLLTLESNGSKKPKRGRDLRELGLIPNGAIIIKDDEIYAVGTTYSLKEKLKQVPEDKIVDAKGRVVMPGFVDAHTHAVFAGTRAKEFHQRIAGKAYMDILKEGGGILNSRKAFAEATDETILMESGARLKRMLGHGTTTVEIKSGYGLNTEQEIRALKLVQQLGQMVPIGIYPTFMGAHAIPPEFKENPEDYVQMVIEEMIPIVAQKKLARSVDVFCEQGVFTLAQTEDIFKAAMDYGLRLRLHSDEIVALGGTELACAMGAQSVDHLVAVTESGIKALAKSDTIAILLPGTVYSLRKTPAPGRKMVEAGVAIGLATDCNPGSCYTESMPMVISLACISMGLSAEESITAATWNSACSLGMQEEIGSLEMHKKADLILLDCKDYREIAYHFGINPVAATMKAGKWIQACE